MQVICAGFGRTGTASLKSALETLLEGRCYHFEELFKDRAHSRLWARFARGETAMDWEQLLDGYVAAVDFPICAYYREIAEVYPDAVVILSEREPKAWATSWSRLWGYFRWFRLRPLRMAFAWVDDIVDVLEHVVLHRTFGGDMSEAGLIGAYHAHVEQVMRTIEPERLLVYRVQQGWEPLCKRLGCAVPEQPFPRHNSGTWPLIRRTVGKMFGGGWTDLAD